jgi:2C-methyl-D-erythritol 2,4-cyclodiphosphate synthase
MKRNIADGLGVPTGSVNVKGKTNDGFGPEGQGQAISATVVVQVATDAK